MGTAGSGQVCTVRRACFLRGQRTFVRGSGGLDGKRDGADRQYCNDQNSTSGAQATLAINM